MTLLFLNQTGLTVSTKIGAFHSVEHKEGSLNLADLLESGIDLGPTFVCGQFAQHRRWCNLITDMFIFLASLVSRTRRATGEVVVIAAANSDELARMTSITIIAKTTGKALSV